MGALGGFMQGYRGMSQNPGLQQVNKEMDDYFARQREEIERKKGRVADMDGLLASAYRRTGNLDQADALARSVALQQLDADQQAHAANTKSETAMAASRQLSANLQAQQAEQNLRLQKYIPPGMGGGGPDPRLVAKANEIAGQLVLKGDDPEMARRRAFSAVGLAVSNVGGYTPPGKEKGVSQKDAENIRAHQNAIENINKLIEMRKANNGGSFSPTDKRVAAGLAARTQENLVAALGKTNQGLLERTEKLIPDDPLEHNASGVFGADPTLANMESAREQLQSELGRIQQNPGTPGTAGDEGIQVSPEPED
jgi:hypothetical protein